MTHSSQILPHLPNRPKNAHKGTFGKVIVFGGSSTMIGAPALTANGSARIGAGLVQIAAPQNILPHCLTIEPSATGHALPLDYQHEQLMPTLNQIANTFTNTTAALAVGPGMGIGLGQQHLIKFLLQLNQPVVLDADGLTNLCMMDDPTRIAKCPLVMTPHPGEFQRLAKLLHITDDPTCPDQRPVAAQKLATAFNCIVVLKGAQTVVTDAEQLYINQTGNPALATGGTGDVLTGIIAGLLAQQVQPYDAATLGVYLHGLTADLWAKQNGQAGLLARELASLIPTAMQQHCNQQDLGATDSRGATA